MDLSKLDLASEPPTPGGGHDEPKWPLARCSTPGCSTITRWSKMLQERVYFGEEEDAPYEFKRTCAECIMLVKGFSQIGEAHVYIMQVKPDYARKADKVAKFKSALQNVQLIFPMMAGKKKETYKKTMAIFSFADFQELFAGLSKHVIRKKEALEKECEDVARHAELCAELATCTDVARQDALIDEIEKLSEHAPMLAFAKHQDQERMLQACAYSDTWVTVRRADGTMSARLDSYYICKAKIGYEDCLRVTESKGWGTRGVDMIDATRWDCYCNAKYKAGAGQIVVLTRVSKTMQIERYYMTADVPGSTFEDIRGMSIEEGLGDETNSITAEELLARIASLKPEVDDLIVPCTKGPGTKFVSRAVLETLPHFDWYQIFNLVGLSVPKRKHKH